VTAPASRNVRRDRAVEDMSSTVVQQAEVVGEGTMKV
jgi:hypothetical protein